MKQTIRVGSRDSELALIQAEIVMRGIRAANPEAELELVGLRTTGDRNLTQSLDDIGGKGLFIKELEQALLDNVIDIAVHSYKDMPYEDRPDLPIVALSPRESAFDVLVLPDGKNELDNTLPVGTSSQRRAIQFKRLVTDVEIKSIRGNVNTRLAKLDLGEYSALILAEAGLKRMQLDDRISRVFTVAEMIPSGSQGIIAVQARLGENCAYLSTFHSWESEVVSLAERQYLKTLGSDCTAPVAVYGELEGDLLRLRAMFVDSDGNVEIGQKTDEARRAQWLGESLASELMERAGVR